MFSFFKKKPILADELSMEIIRTSWQINSDFIDACDAMNLSNSIERLMNLYMETNVFLLFVLEMIVEHKKSGNEKITLVNEVTIKLIDFVSTTAAFQDIKEDQNGKIEIFKNHFQTEFYSYPEHFMLFESNDENPALTQIFCDNIINNYLEDLDENLVLEIIKPVMESVIDAVSKFTQTKSVHQFLE